LNRSFASRPIIQTGKLTTTSRSNAGHLCAANNGLFNIKPEPAETDCYETVGKKSK